MFKVEKTRGLSSLREQGQEGCVRGELCKSCDGHNSGSAVGPFLEVWRGGMIEDALDNWGEAWPRRNRGT